MNQRELFNMAMQELLQSTRFIKEALDCSPTSTFTEYTIITRNTQQWYILHTHIVFENKLILRRLDEFKRHFDLLKKEVYFLRNQNEFLSRALEEEQLRPPYTGGSVYEKCKKNYSVRMAITALLKIPGPRQNPNFQKLINRNSL